MPDSGLVLQRGASWRLRGRQVLGVFVMKRRPPETREKGEGEVITYLSHVECRALKERRSRLI